MLAQRPPTSLRKAADSKPLLPEEVRHDLRAAGRLQAAQQQLPPAVPTERANPAFDTSFSGDGGSSARRAHLQWRWRDGVGGA